MEALRYEYLECGPYGHYRIPCDGIDDELIWQVAYGIIKELEKGHFFSFCNKKEFLLGRQQVYPRGKLFAVYLYRNPNILIASVYQNPSPESRLELKRAVEQTLHPIAQMCV